MLVVLIGIVTAVVGNGAQLESIQLGTDPGKVLQVVAHSSVRSAANRAIAIDYAFLASYWAAFVALAALLARRGGPWLAVAALAAAAATATATLDIVENLRTSAVLALYQPGARLAQTQLDALRHVSLLKWGAAATTVTPLAGVFAQRGKVAAIAVLLLVVAGIGFAGTEWHSLIEVYEVGVVVLSLGIGVLLLARPGAVTRRAVIADD